MNTVDSELASFYIAIAKALGWYQNIYKKQYTMEKLGTALSLSKSSISKRLILPDKANEITGPESFQKTKKPLTLAEAHKLAQSMGQSLSEILYLYEHRKAYEANPASAEQELSSFNKKIESFLQETSTRSIDHTTSAQDSTSEQTKTPHSDSHLLTNPDNTEFASWFGTYNCYFSSTSSEEAGHIREEKDVEGADCAGLGQLFPPTKDNIYHALLTVHTSDKYADGLCHVDLSFISSSSQNQAKQYKGTLSLSSNRGTAFFSLQCPTEEEAAYIIVDEASLTDTVAEKRCCLGMVLSLSNRPGARRPCCEKILISSELIPSNSPAYASMKAHLQMNDSYIRITAWGYNELLKEIELSSDEDLKAIKSTYPTLKDLEGDTVTIEETAFIPESTVSKLKHLTWEQQKKYLFLLRSHSLSSWYYKVNTSKVDDVIKMIAKQQQ